MGFVSELDKIETFSRKIIELYHNGCRNNFEYQEIFKSYIPNIVSSKDDSVGIALQNHMNEQRNLALNEADNKVVRMKFGFEYMYNQIWKYIREQGIGHMSHLCVKGHTFVATINISLGLHKDVNESKEEFSKRNDEFLKNVPYDYEYDSLINSYKIKNSTKNIELLFDLLHKVFNFEHYEMSTRNNYIKELIIYTKDITIPSKEKSIALSEDARFESILKDAKELYQSVNTVRQFPSVWDNVQPLVSSLYYSLCIQLDYECDYTKEYENLRLPHREVNIDTNDKVEKIGSTVSPSEVLDTASSILNNLYNYLENTYCVHSTIRMERFGVIGDFVFMRELALMHSKKEFVFDQYKNTDWDEYEYVIDFKHMEDIINYLKSDDIEVTDFSVKSYSSLGLPPILGVHQINFNITNMLKLNRWREDTNVQNKI